MSWSELSLGPGTWILAVLAGGVLGMDAVSWPQVMVSRPLVSATIGGWLLGNPAAGMLVGAVLEIYALRHPPFGAAKYPDTGPAGLVAGASYAASGGAAMGALLLSIAVGWGLAWIGTVTVHVRRRLNERIMSPAGVLAADPGLLEQRHRMAIWLDALRGAILVAAFLVPSVLAVTLVVGTGPSSLGRYAIASLVLGLAASAGAAGRASAFGVRGWPLILVGAGLGLLLVWGGLT
ncbi:MAG: PTS sugar transporter subunit IIC [Gemmatimonadetes bacterium]|nr:PTS sugar transporter subunit IIC [Gemmatimonadota bacterium]MCK5482592.1 PTS sugar transporter subunit IIC [Gemmatimonadota bacterium]MCK5489430.1 PTS sugar transporter subunit IIC [Gemmatimonadota bacterium]